MSTNGTHRLLQDLESLAPTVACSEPFIYREYWGEGMDYARKPVIIESAWPLIINGQNWLTVLCTPTKLDYFVLGFLHNEGLITNPEDVLHLQIDQPPEGVIRVELQDRDVRLPERRTLTSGCGGGITFVDLAAAREPVCSSRRVTARRITALMSELMPPWPMTIAALGDSTLRA